VNFMLTGGFNPLPPFSPNSFSTTVFVLAYIDLTKSKNGSTKGSASSYMVSYPSASGRRKRAHLVGPKSINHDLDTDQSILLILSLDQFNHQTHHASLEWFERVGMW